jgi:hypothetical protein
LGVKALDLVLIRRAPCVDCGSGFHDRGG